MVLRPVQAAGRAGGWMLAHPLKERPDANRVAGITGALVLNAAALMLMLVPLSTPPPVALAEPDIEMIWVDPPKPPTPPPPVIRPATPQPPPEAVRPAAAAPPAERPVAVAVPVFAQAELPLETAPVEAAPVATAADPAPVAAGSSLRYVAAPAPDYPRDAMLAGREGTVLLRVTVGVDGRPRAVAVERSSGRRDFDDAARRQVLRRWTFQPAIVDGRAVESVGLVPIDFRLQ